MASSRQTALKAGIRAGKSRNSSRSKQISDFESELGRDLNHFVNSWKENRFLEIASAVARREGSTGTPKITLKGKVPSSVLTAGGTSERLLMQAMGWYWEPLLHDLAFFEDMRDSIAIFDGEIQKLADIAMDGFRLQVTDPKKSEQLNKMLFRDSNVDFAEALRASIIDLFSLGNCYRLPIYKKDDKGQFSVKTFKPVRANAMRKLRDQDLATEGYVQLLHRPSEFIFGPTPPQVPTIWLPEEVLCGSMRMQGWYAYGKPLLASLPLVVRLKLTMERDLAEMLHQHVPRIDVTFVPAEQMNQDKVDQEIADIKSEVKALRPSDNFIHTPDTQFEYKGPAGHGLDFGLPQKHIEQQLFYVLPLTASMLGADTTSNPYDSQQRWKITAIIANQVRKRVEAMYAPFLEKAAIELQLDDPIGFAWSELDPESQMQLSEADEYEINNAALKRDNGFIDQDTAARQATAKHPDGPVKTAAAPGKLPPPIDPNKQVEPGATPDKVKDKRKGPSKDGTKAPASDKRPKGRRHRWLEREISAALARFG